MVKQGSGPLRSLRRPPRAPKAPTPPPPPSPQAVARAALERFWGRSNGGAKAYQELEQALLAELHKGGLNAKLLAKLRRNLPVTQPGGTTAQKIEAARGLLLDLEEDVE